MKYFAEDKGEGRERPLNGMLRPPQLSPVQSSPFPSYAALYYARDLLPGREGGHRAICEFPHAQGVQVICSYVTQVSVHF